MLIKKGLIKIAEECGELIQEAMKLVAFPNKHPDRKDHKLGLQQEIADVLACVEYVVEELELDSEAIQKRKDKKLKNYKKW